MYKNKKNPPQQQPDYLLNKEINIHEQLNFILKTYQLINNQQHSSIIHWNNTGSSFIIEDIEKFEKQLLPLYFRHNKYQSFVRQLNMYDFHKIRNSDYCCKNKSEFHHQNFSLHHIKQISQIKRKGFQPKKRDKPNEKTKIIHKKENNKKYKTPTLNLPKKISQTQPSKPQQKQPISLVSLSPQQTHIKQQLQNQKTTKLQQLIQDIKTHYQNRTTTETQKKISKMNHIIQLAQQVKDKWIEYFDKISGIQDIKIMKEIYYRIENQLNSESKQFLNLSTTCISSNIDKSLISSTFKLSEEIDKQIQLDLFQMIEEEDALIQSIFKAQIQSSLICITSEAFINDQFIRKMDTLMAM